MAIKTKRPKKRRHGIPAQISGMAGVYYVAYELSRRGCIALPTNRNVAGFDMVVSSQNGLNHAFLQIKTVQNKANFWLLNRPVPDYMRNSNLAFYVFVRFDKKQDKVECFVASAKEVAKQADHHVREFYKTHSRKTEPSTWTYWWEIPKVKEAYLSRWDKLKLLK